jgi:hypothetical protein
MLLVLIALPVLTVVCAGECGRETAAQVSAEGHCHQDQAPEGPGISRGAADGCTLAATAFTAARDRWVARAPVGALALHALPSDLGHALARRIAPLVGARAPLTGTPPGHHLPLRL